MTIEPAPSGATTPRADRLPIAIPAALHADVLQLLGKRLNPEAMQALADVAEVFGDGFTLMLEWQKEAAALMERIRSTPTDRPYWFFVADEPDCAGDPPPANAIAEYDDLEIIELESEQVFVGPSLFVFRTADGWVWEFASQAEAESALEKAKRSDRALGGAEG